MVSLYTLSGRLGEGMNIRHGMVLLFLIWEALEDIKSQKLSVNSLGAFLIMGLGIRLVYFQVSFWELFVGMWAGILVLLAAKVTEEAIGYGDGVVILIVGIYAGLKMTLYTMLLAFIIMMLFSMVILVRKGFRANMRLPFVPCILFGYIGGLIL